MQLRYVHSQEIRSLVRSPDWPQGPSDESYRSRFTRAERIAECLRESLYHTAKISKSCSESRVEHSELHAQVHLDLVQCSGLIQLLTISPCPEHEHHRIQRTASSMMTVPHRPRH